jgi:hypothetical protein
MRKAMKTEMKMLDNGNYEEVISPIQHHCQHDSIWKCVEYAYKPNKLFLTFEEGDLYEEGGITKTIEVKFCPFCGYSLE